ncbi:isochorismatase family cysteine hydrolase [Parasphingorhabdus halotolerans]|uniref:Cysteine hydrolase n=1 Tax=Parasphingorhabdus halotolerans TaxID=2725558 RepID=A0A6H2DQK9_9SPHN|nr:isochorismatase family cysteine hydrolase [Parasphingorhabdus halotolerans]QJB70488.1 cysteine hydrolase [Parasphingorhabdus halotolerans]
MRKIIIASAAMVALFSNAQAQTVAQLTPSNTAVVVVEFQKQWTEPGFYNRMIKSEYESRNIFENTVNLLDSARENNFPVVQAPLVIDPKNKKGWFAWLTFASFFTKGTKRAEFTDGIVKKSDIIVNGRYAFDGFKGSDLDAKLKKAGSKNLLFCGFTTEHCVDMTMKEAEERGYNVWLISDCTATKSQKLQKRVEESWNAKGRLLSMAQATAIFEKPKSTSGQVDKLLTSNN